MLEIDIKKWKHILDIDCRRWPLELMKNAKDIISGT
jgi:hypothetical protein